MKITHRKQKGERYALVLETEEEAKEFAHYVGCKGNIDNCSVSSVKSGDFQYKLESIVFGKIPGSIRLPI